MVCQVHHLSSFKNSFYCPLFSYLGHTRLFLCTSHNFFLKAGYFRQYTVGTLATNPPPSPGLLLLFTWLVIYLFSYLAELILLSLSLLPCSASGVPIGIFPFVFVFWPGYLTPRSHLGQCSNLLVEDGA